MNITVFSLGPERLKDELRDLGGNITHEDSWSDDAGIHDYEIEVYFEDEWSKEIDEGIDELRSGTKWYVDWGHDFENNGILFEWSRHADTVM